MNNRACKSKSVMCKKVILFTKHINDADVLSLVLQHEVEFNLF